MDSITLKIDREYACDVLVCGGGVSGFAAAVSAARSGARVILLESGGFLGGTATKGLVGPFMTSLDAKGERQIIKGLFAELVDRLVAEQGAYQPLTCRGGDSFSGYRIAGHVGCTPFDYEVLKRVMEQICLEAGVKLLFHTTVIGCSCEDGRITRVHAAAPCQILSISAGSFIDTTGSAALAAYAGAETVWGDENGALQTASLFFVIDGVNKAVLDAYIAEHGGMRERFFMDVIERAQADGSFPCGTQKLRIYEAPNGTWRVNMAQVDERFDELDCETVTSVEISQRVQMMKLIEFLRRSIPGLEDIRLLESASDIGIRESRRIVGKHVLRLEDLQAARKFDDRIAICANSIDIHQKKGVAYTAHTVESYSIPLSCLISSNIRNLLAAGKTVSADRYAFAAVRVMPPCIAMGQAAGIAAAIAALESLDADAVPASRVQQALLQAGAVLD